MRLISANVLLDRISPMAFSWERRKLNCIKILLAKDYDIISLQELSHIQSNEIKKHLIGYIALDTALQQDPLNTIFLKSSAFTVSDLTTIQLPINAVKTQKNLERYANIVNITHKTSNTKFILINTHLSYESATLNVLQSTTINNYMNTLFAPTTKMILTGDLNHSINSPSFNIFKQNNWVNAHAQYYETTPATTYHGFKSNTRGEVVDYILTKNLSKNIQFVNILDNMKAEAYGSDHFFIEATFEL